MAVLRAAAGFWAAVARSNLGRLGRPYRANFCVTYACQSRCNMCSIWKMRPAGELRVDEVWQFARKAPYLRWVQLTGGEPFLRPDLGDIAAAFAENCPLYILSLPSNSLCPPKVVERRVREMLALGVPHLVLGLSVDGPEAVHDAQRRVRGNFRRAMELYGRLEGLQGPGFKLAFEYTMTAANVGALRTCVAEVRAAHPRVTEDDFHLNYAQVSASYYGNAGAPAFQADAPSALWAVRASLARRRGRGLMGRMERWWLADLARWLETGKSPRRGREMDASFYLDSWGSVYPSIMWGLRLGGIRDANYDLGPIWDGPEAARARATLRNGWGPGGLTACDYYTTRLGSLAPAVI